MTDFIDRHFAVLMLGVFALIAWFGTVHLMHTQGIDASNLGWAREQSSLIIGALLGLLTGSRLAQRNGQPPAPPENKPDATT